MAGRCGFGGLRVVLIIGAGHVDAGVALENRML
jgi:hypothetical protein